jgi:hypothetical protein
VHRQRDQALLRAVVEVALDPAPLRVGRGDDLGPAAGQRFHPQRQLLGAAGTEQRPRRDLVRVRHAARHPGRGEQHGDRQHGGDQRGARPPATVAPEAAGEAEPER